jgi:hypothetical protein
LGVNLKASLYHTEDIAVVLAAVRAPNPFLDTSEKDGILMEALLKLLDNWAQEGS